jgi:HPt (histidine-containing phosphotransfer) domain-containing protein
MIEEIRARFLPRFLDTARGRLARARDAVANPKAAEPATVAHEIHALAGEAALLELEEVARLARGAEQAARKWTATGEGDDVEGCRVALVALEDAVSRVES